MELTNELKDRASDFRAIVSYNILYGKTKPSRLDLQFLLFWAETYDNSKLKSMVIEKWQKMGYKNKK